MKFSTSLIYLLLQTLFVLSRRAKSKNDGGSVLRIMPLGDSITVGYTGFSWDQHPFQFGYRSELYRKLKSEGWQFKFVGQSTQPWIHEFPIESPTNEYVVDLRKYDQDGHRGYGGISPATLNQKVEGRSKISHWLKIDQPDLILLKIGTNGVDTVLETQQQELSKAVATIMKEKKRNAHLIVAQIFPFGSYDYFKRSKLNPNWQHDINERVRAYNHWIKTSLIPQYELTGKVSTVDCYSPFLINPVDETSLVNQSLYSNGFNHPNAAGYELLAQTWYNEIKRLKFEFTKP